MPLFEDEVTDARMRRTVPEFALLGATLVAASAPFLVHTPSRRAFVLGLAGTAVGIAFGIQIRGFIYRMTHRMLWGLLAAFCVLIALTYAATDDVGSPYRFLTAVPVTFAATFFTGWKRFSVAILAPIVELAIAGRVLPITYQDLVGGWLMWLFLALFGSVVAGNLRETLRSTRALHTVLEAASGRPYDADLAAIGLTAALQVAGWAKGCVFVRDGDRLAIAAHHGIADQQLATYRASPRRLSGPSMLAEACRTGETRFVPDATVELPEENELVREGVRSFAIVPLVHHGDPIGALLVADTSVRNKRQIVERLERVADQLALALGSANAFRRETDVSARLRELNRRKDEFLANVSHELRTPAATIKLVAATLRASSDRLTRSQLDEMYGTLERRSEHLAVLIESLLEQAVAEAGHTRLTMDTIDWREAVNRWVAIVRTQTGRDIEVSLPAGAVTGRGDTVKLERVVSNLLSNAAKFSSPSTPIGLTLRADESWVEIDVSDLGSGIPDDELEHIFDRFHQIDAAPTRAAGGVGIGLSLVRHFVEAHGGSVAVRSTLGVGSTFTIRIPRSPVTVDLDDHVSVQVEPR